LAMAQDIWNLFAVVVPVGSSSFVNYFNQSGSFFGIFLDR